MKYLFLGLFIILFNDLLAQSNVIFEGYVLSDQTSLPLLKAQVRIPETDFLTTTNDKGYFKLTYTNAVLGETFLLIDGDGYLPQKIPLTIENQEHINLGSLFLKRNMKQTEQYLFALDISDLNQNSPESTTQPLLSATKDPVLKSAAYHWSAAFFRLRGLGNENQSILLNGLKVNSSYNDRPNWNHWSGLNDVVRNQDNTNYFHPNSQSFGSLNGVTNINLRAGSFNPHTKISAASTNRSFGQRILFTHHSGFNSKNWAYSFSASARRAQEGYFEGTVFKAGSIFASVEKALNAKHSLSASFIYTPVQRGKTSPNTEEVTQIKGIRYNAYWGAQDGTIRNSRLQQTNQPILMLSHIWQIKPKWRIQNNVMIQYGTLKNSRLDYTGTTAIINGDETFFEGVGTNPDPTYYQKLPGYFLRTAGQEDYENAFLADRKLRSNGQIDWAALYTANLNTLPNATYMLFNDVSDDLRFGANSIWNYIPNDHSNWQAVFTTNAINSENYAQISDLLGSSGYLDVDPYNTGTQAQNNLRNPNKIVIEDDPFRYHYRLQNVNASSFLQYSFNSARWKLNAAVNLKANVTQRNGFFENGNYPGTASFGKSNYLKQISWGFKTYNQYQISPKMYVSGGLFLNQVPLNMQKAFVNVRQSNQVTPQPQNEQQLGVDVTLNYRYRGINFRGSGYVTQLRNSTKNSFFYAEDIAGLGRVENAGFFQEQTTGMHTQYTGVELGADIKVTTTLSLHAAMSLNTSQYVNNPNLALYVDTEGRAVFNGKTLLKNYFIANGPQQVYGIGFSYRDPKYWWFSTQINYYNNAYSNISPFLRTENFALDVDGLPIVDYDENRARELLQQERFNPYVLWNAIGGKSWKIKQKYLGFTLGVQNILNQVYKTGGFEQSRNANYNSLSEDQNRENPLFGSKYWHGSGATYYLNTYLRF